MSSASKLLIAMLVAGLLIACGESEPTGPAGDNDAGQGGDVSPAPDTADGTDPADATDRATDTADGPANATAGPPARADDRTGPGDSATGARPAADADADDTAGAAASRGARSWRGSRADLPDGFRDLQPAVAADDAAGVPGISQWTRTGAAGDHIVIAGYNFKPDNDPQGETTQFVMQAHGMAGPVPMAPRALRPFRAIVQLPAEVDSGEVVLVWPENATGKGQPIAVNKPEAWWTWPRRAAPGQTVSVFGRNLSHRAGTDTGWVWLNVAGAGDGRGWWVRADQANPYKLDFTLPDDLPQGELEVWVHNGTGGTYGWAALHDGDGGAITATHLTVTEPWQWTGPRIDVTDLGARGDGKTDDTAAIARALEQAAGAKRATVYFPPGQYMVGAKLTVTSPDNAGVRLLGEGPGKSAIVCLPEARHKLMVDLNTGNVELRGLRFDVNNLGETENLYTGAQRNEHDPAAYARRAAEAEARKQARAQRKRAIREWKRNNKNKPLPEHLQPKKKPDKPARDKPKPVHRKLLQANGYASGLTFVDCIFDGERSVVMNLGGRKDVLIEGCDIIGKECQIATITYAMIRDCHFYGRADAPVMMYSYGGWCQAIINNTGQDYQPMTYDTAMGRFYTVSAYGQRVENIYIADNRTHDLTVQPGHFNQNSGEQIMWEFMPGLSTQKPTAVDGQTLSFARPIGGKVRWYGDAVVIAGKGLGQWRKVNSYDKKSGRMELAQPWRVAPNTDSTIAVSQPIQRVVVYRNQLDAKPRAYQSQAHIASSGVQPFGASVDLTVDSNTFHEIRTGIVTFTFRNEKKGIAPTLFHLYQNNTFDKQRWGISNRGRTTGIVSRNNRMSGLVLRGYQAGGPTMNVFEQQQIADAPIAIEIDAKAPEQVDGLLLFQNKLRLGDAEHDGSIGIKAPTREALILEDNTIQGFAEPIVTE